MLSRRYRCWLPSLRNKLGYVSQRAVLFSGSGKSNIFYGDNGRAAFGIYSVAGAVSMAQASEFVKKWITGCPHGLPRVERMFLEDRNNGCPLHALSTSSSDYFTGIASGSSQRRIFCCRP